MLYKNVDFFVRMTMRTLEEIYKLLLNAYGPQGWWPLSDIDGINPTKTGSISGYHPGDYSYPRTEDQRFEICAGAILTQNSAWTNAEKGLLSLKKSGMLRPQRIVAAEEGEVARLIRPCGYYNQKAKKLKVFSSFFISNPQPSRADLLNLWGIGNETADSMLLYAFKVPTFVIDTYARRIFASLGIVERDAPYDEIKAFFEKNIEPDTIIYQEFHALIVEHAKRYHSKKVSDDPLFS
jgi:endonuclease III related protein